MKQPRNVAVALVYCQATHRVLVVTSRKHERLWIFPKGGVEKGETSAQAAAREAHEEAGIVFPPLDTVGPLTVFPLLATADARQEVWHFHAVLLQSEDMLEDTWLEADERKRRWLTPREALAAMREWGPHPGPEEPPLPEDAAELAASLQRGGWRKKAAKGRAFEAGLTAFAHIYGWDKK